MKPKPPLCSFCRKGPEDVGPIVEGATANICGQCTELCQSIIDQERRRHDGSEPSRLPSRAAIRGGLDAYVGGQRAAQEALANAAFTHYAQPRSEPSRPVLLLGPSSAAKLVLLRALAHILEVPFKELNVDSLRVEPEGDEGRIDQMSGVLLQNCDFDLERARRTLVFVDAAEQPAVQDALLRCWDSDPAGAAEFGVALRELLVFCGADIRGIANDQPISAEVLITQGMKPEFVRRLGTIVTASPIDEPSQRRLAGAVDFGKCL